MNRSALGAVPASVRAYDWIAHHARRTPGKLATVDHPGGRRLTYRELDERKCAPL